MKLTVNGIERNVDSAPLQPLLHVLREELGITSPKAGCQQGGCGSCTVLVDGEPRRSCLLALAAVDGAEITTLEGLGTPEALAPIQAAFHESYAAQCGFCTSGMVLAAHAYLEGGGGPDREDIQEALAGHICRCTGYVKILDAVSSAAGGEASSNQRWLPQAGRGSARRGSGSTGMKAVGARLPRYDGVAHVTGRTQFVDDVRIPGTLWVKALRSPAHHADIKRLDVSKAEGMAGVHAIITWEDVPLLEYGHLSALGIPADEPLLAKDNVRYQGQPIALVAAEDEVTAQAAVDAIELELEEKPALFDVRKAFDSDAAVVHHWGNWYPHFEEEMDRRQIRKGSIADAFEQADTIVQGVYRPLRSSTFPSRRRCARSCPRPTDGSRSTPARRRSTSRWASSLRISRCR